MFTGFVNVVFHCGNVTKGVTMKVGVETSVEKTMHCLILVTIKVIIQNTYTKKKKIILNNTRNLSNIQIPKTLNSKFYSIIISGEIINQ